MGKTSLNPILTSSATYLNGFKGSAHALTVAAGGGVDHKLGKHLSARLVDFEYQGWRMHSGTPSKHYSPTFYPYGVSAGVSYRIF